nr:nucleotide disphospho-sugar-binding domain-containing protein [uncultured Cellulosilyticum sp.]
MDKIIYFMLPLYGHMNPNINLLKQLSESNNKVICYTTPKFQHMFEGLNIQVKYYTNQVEEFYRLPANIQEDKQLGPFQLDISRGIRSQAIRANVELISAVYNSHIDEVKAFKPECILYDSVANWGSVFGEKLNIPYFSIEAATWDSMDKYNKTYRDYLNNVVVKAINKEINIEQIILHKKKLARELTDRYSAIVGKRSKHIPNLSIALASPMLQIASNELDASHKYCGFHLEVKAPSKDKNLIYVTRGTVQNQEELNVLRKMICCLKSTDEQIEVSSGGKAQYQLLKYNEDELPKNVMINEFINQIDILTKAKIMVCHGGITGVREAIFCGTPMIIYPYNYHCYQVGRAVEKAKAGILLKNYPFDPEELLQAIKTIEQDDIYQQGVERVKQELEQRYKTQSVISIIEQYMKTGK